MYEPRITSYITIACWAAWIFYWIVSWRKQKPVTEQQPPKERAAYTIMLMIGFILALSDTRHLPVLKISILPYSTATALIGAALCAIGLAITIWARNILSDNWSADVSFKKDQELITAGPYSLVRHPIYTGLIALFVGTAIVQGNLAACAAILFAFVSFLIKLDQEEKMMAAHFENKYLSYQKHTKKIIPYIY